MPDPVLAQLVAERPDLDAGPPLAPVAQQPCPRFRIVDGGVEHLDAMLRRVAHRPLALSPGDSLLNATSDLSSVLLSDGASVTFVGSADFEGTEAVPTWRLSLVGADSATFLPRGRLIVTAPSELAGEGQGVREPRTHRVMLLDQSDGSVLHRLVLDVDDAAALALPHPSDESVVLELGEGQDGSSVHRIDVRGDRLVATEILRDVVVAGFSPDGTRLLLLPHPSFPTPPRVLRWPGLDEIAVAALEDAGIDEDGIDLYGCFLDDDWVLLSTYEQGLWVARGDLTELAPLALPAEAASEEQAFSSTFGLSRDTFCTQVWREDRGVTTVWRLASGS